MRDGHSKILIANSEMLSGSYAEVVVFLCILTTNQQNLTINQHSSQQQSVVGSKI